MTNQLPTDNINTTNIDLDTSDTTDIDDAIDSLKEDSTFQLPSKEFERPLGAEKVNLYDYSNNGGEIVIATPTKDSKWKISNVSINLIGSSDYCKISSNELTKEVLSRSDHFIINDRVNLSDKQMVVFIHTENDILEKEYITNIYDFCALIEVSDQFMLNLPHICTSFRYLLWCTILREKSKKEWYINRVILTNVNQRVYEKKKLGLTDTIPNNNNNNYPQHTSRSQSNLPSTIRFKASPPSNYCDVKALKQLLFRLVQIGAMELFNSVIIVIGTSITNFDLLWRDSKLLDFIVANSPVFSEVIFYSMRIMYLEHRSSLRNSRTGHRHVIKGSFASHLPNYNFEKHLSKSCYFPEIIRTHKIQKLTTPFKYFGDYRGIYTLDTFKERFDVFTEGIFTWISDLDGSIDVDVKNSEDSYSSGNNSKCEGTTKYSVKFGFTGSIMPACLIKNPLEFGFDDFSEYLDEYYPSKKSLHGYADSITDDKEYFEVDNEISKINTMYEIDTDDDDNHSDDNDDGDDDDNDNHSGDNSDDDSTDIVTEENDVNDPYWGLTDIDIAVETIYFDVLVAVVHKFMEKIENHIDGLSEIKDPLFTITCEQTSNHRFSILGLHRKIEIFMVDSICGVISNFHMPCVRAWYDGQETYVFPDFITAAFTGVLVNTAWTSANKDLRDVILKYYQRGFSILLNSHDEKSVIRYVNNNPRWPNWALPQGARWWMVRRFNRHLLYSPGGNKGALVFFNPSVCKKGIHYKLNTQTIRINMNEVVNASKLTKRTSGNSINSTRVSRYRSRKRPSIAVEKNNFDNQKIVSRYKKEDKKSLMVSIYTPQLNPNLSHYM